MEKGGHKVKELMKNMLNSDPSLTEKEIIQKFKESELDN